MEFPNKKQSYRFENETRLPNGREIVDNKEEKKLTVKIHTGCHPPSIHTVDLLKITILHYEIVQNNCTE